MAYLRKLDVTGTNFTSLDFTNICSDLGITPSFSNSYHHQSVPAECSVCTVKNIMKKCHETGTPWSLGLSTYVFHWMRKPNLHPIWVVINLKGSVPLVVHCRNLKKKEDTLEHLIEKCFCEKLYHDKKSRTLADIPKGSTAAILDYRSNT